jgi:hypothetical protein
MAGSCEHSNEPSCSIKRRDFLDYRSVLLASQKGLCSMELIALFLNHSSYIVVSVSINSLALCVFCKV